MATSIQALLTAGGFTLLKHPVPTAHDAARVMVMPSYTGVCGSDIHVYRNRHRLRAPWILGHEISGMLNDGNSRSTVAIHPFLSCATCRFCRLGKDHFCAEGKFVGGGEDYPGSFNGHIVASEHSVMRLPATVSLRSGILVQPLGIVFATIEKIQSQAETILIFGGGPIGAMIALTLRLDKKREKIAVIEPSAWRRRFLAQYDFPALDIPNFRTAVKLMGPLGPDVVIDASNAPHANLSAAVDCIAPAGQILVVGISDEENLVIPYKISRDKSLSIIIPYRCARTHMELALSFLNQHHSNHSTLSQLITCEYPISDIARAFERAENRARDYMKMAIVHI